MEESLQAKARPSSEQMRNQLTNQSSGTKQRQHCGNDKGKNSRESEKKLQIPTQ